MLVAEMSNATLDPPTATIDAAAAAAILGCYPNDVLAP